MPSAAYLRIGCKYTQNMQYINLYFLLFVDEFGRFGKNE